MARQQKNIPETNKNQYTKEVDARHPGVPGTLAANKPALPERVRYTELLPFGAWL